MKTTGKVLWLEEYATSDDKLGFISKVLNMCLFSPSIFIADSM